MARRNRRIDPPIPARGRTDTGEVQRDPDGDWHVRPIVGQRATKTYRCPGCEQPIGPGIAHIVAWRADRHDGEDHRRHWHTPCWAARATRRPSSRR